MFSFKGLLMDIFEKCYRNNEGDEKLSYTLMTKVRKKTGNGYYDDLVKIKLFSSELLGAISQCIGTQIDVEIDEKSYTDQKGITYKYFVLTDVN